MPRRASTTEPYALMKVSSAGHLSPARSQVGSKTGAPVGRGVPTVPRFQPLHVARNVRISRIARPHPLHAEVYGTYPAGATFGPSRRTR
jgi:hypothetical protein